MYVSYAGTVISFVEAVRVTGTPAMIRVLFDTTSDGSQEVSPRTKSHNGSKQDFSTLHDDVEDIPYDSKELIWVNPHPNDATQNGPDVEVGTNANSPS